MVATSPRLPFTRHQPHLNEVPHRSGNRSRTDLQLLGQFRCSELTVRRDQQRCKHACWHPRKSGFEQGQSKALDKPADGGAVTGWVGARHRFTAYTESIRFLNFMTF
jgi:hypothetical protein